MLRLLLPALTVAQLGACGDPAAPVADAAADSVDAPLAAPDADLTVPRPGFGAISGMCGVLGEPELTGATPALFEAAIDFGTDRYDDPAERDQLTVGGQDIVSNPNAGGSSIFSETFAMEVLARCELATFLKRETQIVFDTPGETTDILVEIDGHKLGVSVTRAVTFPFGSAFTPAAAAELVDHKLGGIVASTDYVSDEDRWVKQLLVVMAYDAQHASVFADAFAAADPSLRADTVVLVFVTSGDDLFIYTDD